MPADREPDYSDHWEFSQRLTRPRPAVPGEAQVGCSELEGVSGCRERLVAGHLLLVMAGTHGFCVSLISHTQGPT